MKKRLLFTITTLVLLMVTSMASAHSRRATEKPTMARSENARSNSTSPLATKEVTPIDWDTSAAGFQGHTGKTFMFRCPADGSAKPIYGSDVYTDDSSICTAAVHVGLISVESGGLVTIEIRPGRSTYGSTTRHGIKSINFGEYGRSFIVLSDAVRDNSNREGRISNRADSDDNGDITPIDWDTSAAGFQGEKGRTFMFRCPADGSAKPIYGSDVYTDDSSICTAAVHVGLISVESGGLVTIEIRPGRSTYGSTTRHGIKSINFGEYGRSFIVLSDPVRDNSNKESRISNRADSDDNGDITPIDWDTSAAGFQGEKGRTFMFRCPADGSAKPIYGSDVYTDDSSICTAAVHVGFIGLKRGGVVRIEIGAGRSTYGSTTRHGIKSNTFGEYSRSFVIR